MNTAKLFVNGRSQAVRLPKEYRFDDDEVIVNKLGDVVMLFPRRKGWDIMAQAIERFSDDALNRNQPREAQKRRAV